MKLYLIAVLTLILFTGTTNCTATDNPCDDDYDKEWKNQTKCQSAYIRSPEARASFSLSTTEQAIAKDKFIMDCIKDLTEYQEQYCNKNVESSLQDYDSDTDEVFTSRDEHSEADEVSVLELFTTLAIAAENEEKCEEAYVGSSDQQQVSKLTTTERAIAKEKFILDCVESLTEFQLKHIED